MKSKLTYIIDQLFLRLGISTQFDKLTTYGEFTKAGDNITIAGEGQFHVRLTVDNTLIISKINKFGSFLQYIKYMFL